MLPIFAITTRGLESVSADELRAAASVSDIEAHYRRVDALCVSPRGLESLRTVDDVFIRLATWDSLTHHRAALGLISAWSAKFDFVQAVAAIRQVRSLPAAPCFSVTANFVGKRNYSVPEIKIAVSQGIMSQNPRWHYTEEDSEAHLNIRVFIEHEQAVIGVRIGDHPLHRRPYKQGHLPGSLKPTTAAALVHLAQPRVGQTLLDPFCGSGTIAIEAAEHGLSVICGDVSPEAVLTAAANAHDAHVTRAALSRWDACLLPLRSQSVDVAVTNLPWGRQITVDAALTELYRRAFDELRRVVRGRIILLTTAPDLISETPARAFEISVFGQNPAVMIFD